MKRTADDADGEADSSEKKVKSAQREPALPTPEPPPPVADPRAASIVGDGAAEADDDDVTAAEREACIAMMQDPTKPWVQPVIDCQFRFTDEGGDPVEEVGKFGNAQVMLSVTREGYVLNDDCAFLGGIRQSRKGQHWRIDANVEWISSTREDDWLGMNGGGLPTVPPQ